MTRVTGGFAAIVAVAVAMMSAALARAEAPAPAAQAVRADRAAPAPFQETLLRGLGSSIGVSVRDLSSDEITRARLPQAGGVLVEQVRAESPAARAGMQEGDIVVEFDGERIRSAREFARLVQDTPAGRTATAALLRAGERHTVEVIPEARARAAIDALPGITREIERSVRSLEFDLPRAVVLISPGRLGATLLPLDPQLAEYFGVTQGVLVSSVDAGSPAAQAGLKAGDVITVINGRSVSAAGDVSGEVRRADAGSTLEIRVMRDKVETTVTATLPERERRPVARRSQ